MNFDAGGMQNHTEHLTEIAAELTAAFYDCAESFGVAAGRLADIWADWLRRPRGAELPPARPCRCAGTRGYLCGQVVCSPARCLGLPVTDLGSGLRIVPKPRRSFHQHRT